MEKFRKAYAYEDLLLVPKRSTITSRAETDLSTKLTSKLQLQIPIVSLDMDTVTEAPMAIAIAKLGGVGIIHRYLDPKTQVGEIRKVKRQNLLVGSSIGVKEEDIDRANNLLKAGADFLAVNVAHGHHENVRSMLETLRKKFPRAQLIAGNVATAEGYRFLVQAGADAVRVGIGNGSICITRVVTGFGVPQMTALLDCAKEAKKSGVPMIADGGISASGSIVKALAAGGSSVMLGNLLAGTDESPGKVVRRGGKKFKIYRGMASKEANLDRYQRNGWDPGKYRAAAEGVVGLVPYKGSVTPILEELVGGIRSGLSYAGAHNLAELRENAEFIEITSSGWRESLPHDLFQLE